VPASPGAAGPGPTSSVPGPPAPPAPVGPRWQTPMPRPGYFVVPPTGPGYYSLLDQIRGAERETPPKYPYPRVSPIFLPNYDVNWSYLKDPKNTEHDYADVLKWIPGGEYATFTTGGEFRYRFMNEVNSNGRTSGATDAYNLFRTRIYGDLWVQDWFRIFGEFLYADVTARSIPPLTTDIDRGDILNLFADLRVFKFGEKDNPVYVRVGRQEMLYGSQRLISPLDWVNTRRTFEGVKVFTRTEKWDFDVFGVQPVVPPRPGQFDTADHNQFFSGAWFTYRPKANQAIDLYYLDLNNTNAGAAIGQGGVPGNYNVSTVGSRYAGTANNWLWDLEAMLQFGHYSNQSILAKAFAVDGGYHFKDVMWNPQFWVGYEYASGDPDPQNTPTRRTFNQLFPFGHYYFGFADIVGRQNINDYFVQGILYPANWLTLLTQFHVFRLDSNKDALYGPAGGILRQDKTGKAGDNVGNELDVLSNFHLTNHSDVLVGYSYLWAGSFLKNTAPPGPAHDAMAANPSLFYAQYSYRW
ncbi:MAG: alginate export family protein, partial [Gemmataceae bacterium]|nr:alginate export family protein [Gemmataceae bacterium]